ncbi:MAG TPA: GGDEF domain-containing protein, partial [Pseudomonadales bacterium]|nr:GGDEF domain-containing protein [Pseudomonadales bacterium]
PSTALTGALQIAERIREQVKAEAVVWQEQPIWLTVSIGVASLKIDSSITPDLIVRQADAALYRAKNEGRDRTCWSTESGTPQP